MDRVAVLQQLEREVGVLMRRARRVVGERAVMVHPDLTAQAYLMLSFLVGMGPTRASVIAETFELDKGAVSRNVHALVELGLVTKTADPEDGRALILTPTEASVRRMAEINALRLARLDEQLGGWSQDDLTEFVRAFAQYNLLLE